MTFTLLMLLKILLFMNITSVAYNQLLIFLTSTLFIVFIFTTIYLSDSRKKKIVGLIIYTILSLILFVDVLHYTFFNVLPSVKMLSQVNQVAAVGDSLRELFTIKSLLMVVDLPILFIIILRKKKKAAGLSFIQTYRVRRPRKIRWGIPALLLVAIVANLVGLNLTGRYDPVSHQEPFTFHERDIRTSLFNGEEKKIEKGLEDDKDSIKDLRERARLKEGKHTGIGKGKNLIVLQVEALQNFVINADYNGQEITPNLNKLIKDQGSLYFDRYYQLVGRGNTSDAEFVTNNSLYPSMEEPSYTSYEGNTFYGLPILLKDNGYTSWAFHGYRKEFWNRDKAYVNQGYERFISQEDYDVNRSNIIGLGISDEAFFKQSLDHLKDLGKKDNPFYAFMVTLTSHHPFNMPEHTRVIDIKEEDKDSLLGNYINSIHYTDKEIGKFIELLKEEGLYEDTVIAIYGDHFAINTTDERNHKTMTNYLGRDYRVDEMMNIPLIINVPGENINETISKAGSQMDFYPTITNIMGIDNDKGIVFGRDLVNYKGENLVAPQVYALKGSFINDQIALVMSGDGVFENSQAYNIKTRDYLDVKDYRDRYEKAIKEINLGDYIMKKDLMGDILEGKNDLKVSRKDIKDIKLSKKIKITDGTKESIDQALADGYKTIKLELSMEGTRLVVGRDLDLDYLDQILRDNKDLSLVTGVAKGTSPGAVYRELRDRYTAEGQEDFRPRIYPEVKRLDHYAPIIALGYDVMVNISDLDYKDQEVLDFVDRYDVRLISMDRDRGLTKLPKELKNRDVLSYIYNVEKGKSKWKLKRNAAGSFLD